MTEVNPSPLNAPWRARLHEVIFEAGTPAERAFDVVLLWLIVGSIAVVMLENVSAEIAQAMGGRTISTQACPSCSAEGHNAD